MGFRLLLLVALGGCFPPIEVDEDEDLDDTGTPDESDADTDTDADGDADGDTDADTDTDSDADTDADPDYSGQWSGSWSMSMTESYFGTQDTCAGSLSVTIRANGTHDTDGSGTCAWQGVLYGSPDPHLALSARIQPASGALQDGTVAIQALDSVLYGDLWGGANGAGDQLTGAFEGDGTVILYGFEVPVTYTGTYSVNR